MLYIGIDWATRSHTVALLAGPGKALTTMTIENTLDGFLTLLEAIHKRVGPDKPASAPEEVLFAIEDRNQRLVDFLMDYGFTGYCIAPSRMKGYRLRYGAAGNKNDDKDAFILADVLCRDHDQLSRCKPVSAPVQTLRSLLRDRESFVRDRTRVINRLKACLRQYFPEALELFSDIAGKTALDFIEAYPDSAAARTLSRKQLQAFLAAHRCNRTAQIERIGKVLARTPIPVPAAIVKAKRQQTLRLIRELRAIQQAVAEYEAEIERLGRESAEVERFRSLPGSGPLISAGLYALFGDDRTRFASATAVQSYAGTAPRTMQSGNFRGVYFRYACNRFYRMWATSLAFGALKYSDWAKRYYDGKRAEGKTHHHARRCLANLLLKIAYAMWRDGTGYSEDRYMAQVLRHKMRQTAT